MNAEFRIDGKTLETPRLLLRPFKASDLDDFFEYASVEGVGEMAGGVHHADKEESRRILGHFISEDKTFAVVFRETGKVIGSHVVQVEKKSLLQVTVNRVLALVGIRNNLVVKVKVSVLSDICRNSVEEPETVIRAIVLFLRRLLMSRIVVGADNGNCSTARDLSAQHAVHSFLSDFGDGG